MYRLLTLLVFFIVTAQVEALELRGLADELTGGEFVYTAQKGDSLTSIGARFGVEVRVLAKDNGLNPATRLREGQVLRVDNRHVVPLKLKNGILINVPQRMLFYFAQESLTAHYPVGLGRPDWPTPTGRFLAATKEENPTWDVPKSIQEEMRRERKVVKTQVPPSPENPLGSYWIGLSIPGFGIHGTIAPASIYHFQTHGCIRLHPDDIAELFLRLSIGTSVEIVYDPVLLALESDRIYLEVHRDVYNKNGNLLKTLQNWISGHGLGSVVDWEKMEEVIRNRDGLARDITKGKPKVPNGKGQGMGFFLNHEKGLPSLSFSRREFLGLGMLAAAAGILPRTVQAGIGGVPEAERSLAFYNTHTGESLKAVYWVQGDYVAESLATIDRILRDHRTDEIKAIDVQLLDLLHTIGGSLETRQPIHVISGYRSPVTNSLLHERGRGVALHSLHLEGKAVDVRFPDRDLFRVRDLSISLKKGGVGYYPRSGFVHLDVGRVRFW